MWKPLIRCSIVGGIIVFLWLTISWMILPMHNTTMHEFKNPQDVSEVIMDNTSEDGVYVLSEGPFVFMNVKREGMNMKNMTRPIVIGLCMQIIGAFLITYLLLQAKKMAYWSRVWFVVIAGITVALLGSGPFWNWWGFTTGWTLLSMFDVVMGWFLGGLVIAKLVK